MRSMLWPLRLAADGRVVTAETGSSTDVASCVALLLSTTVGERIEIPTYGVEDPTFVGPDVVDDIIARWEPRAPNAVTVSSRVMEASP